MPNSNLSSVQLDAIREVANIGLGHAMTALSELTGRSFIMEVPSVSAIEWSQVPEMLPAGEPAVAVYMPLTGAIPGHLAFIFPWSSAMMICGLTVARTPGNVGDVDDVFTSAMLEIGNILLGGFLTAISHTTGLDIRAEVPFLGLDDPSTVLTSIAVEAEASGATALAIQTELADRSGIAEGHFFYFPTKDGLSQLIDGLGVREAA